MKYRVTAAHGRPDPVRISNIAGEHVEFPCYVRCTPAEPAPGIKRVVQNERTNLVSRMNQCFGQMRSDEAVGAGDENLFHCCSLRSSSASRQSSGVSRSTDR